MGLEEALAIYLVAIIIPAGPHVEAPDPSLVWALHVLSIPTRPLFLKGNPQGLGALGNACQNLPGAGAASKPPRIPFCLRPKSQHRLEVDRYR